MGRGLCRARVAARLALHCTCGVAPISGKALSCAQAKQTAQKQKWDTWACGFGSLGGKRGEDAVHTEATLCQLALHWPRAKGHFHASMTRWVTLSVLWEGIQTGHSLPRPHRRMAARKVQGWAVSPLSPTLRCSQSTLGPGLGMAALAAGYGSRPICGCFPLAET